KELKLPLGQSHLAALVTDHATRGIQPQTLELPEPAVPQVEAQLVSVHLALDDLEVDGRSLLGRRREAGHVAAPTAEDFPLVIEEIRVDAHPVPRVLPARGPDVLPLEGSGRPAAVDVPAGPHSSLR